jgi:hypothetical protein
MRDAIAPFAADIPVMREAIIAEGKARDVEKRLRWDLSFKAGLTPWVCSTLYSYCDDVHVDTALRAIVREIEPAAVPDPTPGG